MEKPGLTKATSRVKRLEEIFAKLPDNDLNYWKTFYKKDLTSESRYLQERARKLLALIEEAENLLKTPAQPSTPPIIKPEIISISQVTPPTPSTESTEITKAREEVLRRMTLAPEPPEQSVEKTIPKDEWEEIPLIKDEVPEQELDLDLNLQKNSEEMMDLELNPRETAGQQQEDELTKSLTTEELAIVQEEMRRSAPLDFEPEQTKTDVGLFLRNQVVKLVSGLKLSERMKKITKKLRTGILLSTGILVLWPSALGSEGRTVNTLPEGVKEKILPISDVISESDSTELSSRAFDIETYEKLPPNVRNIYLYAVKLDTNYVIVDKPTATMFVIGKDKKLMSSFPVLLGKIKGEASNKVNLDNEYYAGPYATTPAGRYKMGRRLMSEKHYLEYDGGRIFYIYGPDNIAVHTVYPKEYKERTKAINSPDIEDNRLSWGCINITKENFDKYFTGINNAEGATIFITPDNANLSLNPETGKVESQTLIKSQAQTQRTIS